MVLDLPWGGATVGSTGGEQLQYEFDAFDRLRRVFFFDNLTSTEFTVGRYAYDAMGRRVFGLAVEGLMVRWLDKVQDGTNSSKRGVR